MEQLDQSQRLFCEAPPGNIRLLAPAGCGKTLCLLFRCKHLAEQAKPRRLRFLIVTFTVAAKQELLSRLNEDSRFEQIRDSLEITTLNSWGFRRIKNAADFPKLITRKQDYHFAMLNQLQSVWQKYEHIRNAIQNKNSWKRNNAPRKLMSVIEEFKSLGFDHVRHANYGQFAQHWNEIEQQELLWRLEEQFNELAKFDILDIEINEDGKEIPKAENRTVYNVFFKFWIEATAHLIDSATFTFEDQKYFAYLDERKNIDQGRYLSGAASYDHVFVDEFQDINPLDLALVRAIVERNRATLTIAGDDDQAIFEWRGATPEYILNPARFFASQFHTHTLGINYRSPKNIVDHSQQLISHNSRRVPKQVKASSSTNARIEIREIDGILDALDYVGKIIEKSIAQGKSPSRVAIIGRKRSQIIPYQMYFASKDMPFCAAEDLQIFLSDTFGSLLHLLDIKSRSQGRQRRGQVIDDLLFLCDHVKRYPMSKGDKQALRSYLQQSRPANIVSATDALAMYKGTLKGKNTKGDMSITLANAVKAFVDATTVSDTLMVLSQSFEGFQFDFGKAEEDIFYTDPPFFHLAEYASSYGDDYDAFIDDIEEAKETLVYMPPFEDDDQENLWDRPLHLMTALRAKGKEFDTVILLDVNDGIWPNRNAKTAAKLEAERRVFYVAFTRAKERIVLLRNDRIGNREAVISPYIQELEL